MQSDPIQCFWVDRLPKISRRLRRFSLDRECPIERPGCCACCDAKAPLDVIDYQGEIIGEQEHPRDDPRWPKVCERCGYVFAETDYWQVFSDWIYRRADTGEEHTFRNLPAGAMFNCHWASDTGPDGIACTLILPDRTAWNIDGSAHGNGKFTPHAWTRTGTPPNISATPSILTSAFHGWLKNGWLSAC